MLRLNESEVCLCSFIQHTGGPDSLSLPRVSPLCLFGLLRHSVSSTSLSCSVCMEGLNNWLRAVVGNILMDNGACLPLVMTLIIPVLREGQCQGETVQMSPWTNREKQKICIVRILYFLHTKKNAACILAPPRASKDWSCGFDWQDRSLLWTTRKRLWVCVHVSERVFRKEGKAQCVFDVGNPRAQGLQTVCWFLNTDSRCWGLHDYCSGAASQSCSLKHNLATHDSESTTHKLWLASCSPLWKSL